VDDEQLLRIDAELRQRRPAQHGRWIEQHHAAAGLQRRGPRDARERRHQQAQLTDAGVRQQQLGQHLMRPAAAGQLGIERGEAARGDTPGRRAELMRAPQRSQSGRHLARRRCRLNLLLDQNG